MSRKLRPGTANGTTGDSPMEQTAPDGSETARAAFVPLCVDMDGTLVKSDTLLDSILALARQRPLDMLRIPGWIAQGKAAFKQRVTRAVTLDVEHLPYNRGLLTWLRQQHGAGRRIYLATAADNTLAERVARHLGIFDGVLASDGKRNLAGGSKLAAFREKFGDEFCYIGNALPDAPLLAVCREPMTANPNASLRAAMRRSGTVTARSFEDRSPRGKAWLKAIRLHQWAKNALLYVPLLLAHDWSRGTLVGAAIGFVSFGLCASATYILNDLLDLEADRRHRAKRNRPFAAGDLSVMAGVLVVKIFFWSAVALALLLPHAVVAAGGPRLAAPYKFLEWIGIYFVTTLAYSLVLKRKMLIDVIVLSGLYTVRIMAGSAATGVAVSPWLLGFSIFFFLSLAFVKRFSELEGLRARAGAVANGRGYGMADLEQLRAFGTGVGCASAVVLTLYINDPSAAHLYRHPARLWLVVPVLLLWLFRIWMLASRGEMDEDPVVYAITDKRSLLLGAIVAGIVVLAL